MEPESKDEEFDPNYMRPSLKELINKDFYKEDGWFDLFCEALFKIKYRGTTIKAEFYHGIIHFISCLYCLAVVPQQLSAAGYNPQNTVVAVALLCGVGSICCGLFANLPFVMAPPTVVTIFQSVYLQQHNIGPRAGNLGVIFSGLFLMLFFYRPLGEFVKHLIPIPIQVGTVVGIGLLTALAGSTEVGMVTSGEYTILALGSITPEIIISFVGVWMISVAVRYHIKGSFCIAVIFCSIVWWSYDRSFPDQYFAVPTLTTAYFKPTDTTDVPLLTVDLLFVYILYLNGLLQSLSNLAVLTRKNNSIPRGRWVFIMSGFFTVCGGLLSTAPILVSPESASAIKEGAKTGLSTIVAGLFFLVAAFFGPLFERIPAAGTSPVLIMIGLILFQNVNRVDWKNIADAAPAFVVLFYIPFTYSIIQGVILGYIMYISITLCTGEFLQNALFLCLTYFPEYEEKLSSFAFLEPYMPREPESESESESGDFGDDDTEIHARLESSMDHTNMSAASPRSPSTASIGAAPTGKSSKSGKSSSSHHRQDILAAFVDMNPGMSFSAPEVRPLRKTKSTKEMRSNKSGGNAADLSPSRDPSFVDKNNDEGMTQQVELGHMVASKPAAEEKMGGNKNGTEES